MFIGIKNVSYPTFWIQKGLHRKERLLTATVSDMLAISLLLCIAGCVVGFRNTHRRSGSPWIAQAQVDSDLIEKPAWSAGGLVSDIVNALIKSPLYTLMKPLARQALINTAEKASIPWVSRRESLRAKQTEIDRYFKDLEVSEMTYPKYYTQPFHAYDLGNLNFDAAYECESATMSMALRVWPSEQLTAEEAQMRLRSSFLDTVDSYIGKNPPPRTCLDVGCSVGVSSFYLADKWPSAAITGVDLSPHFLSVAVQRQKALGDKYDRITWRHANMETPPDEWKDQYDLTAASFMFHELPTAPAIDILQQMVHVTKPDGVIAITDNDPKSSVIQNLPPAIFTLMKSTEPHSDEYYAFAMERALERLGCVDVKTVQSDPRHRTILARKVG